MRSASSTAAAVIAGAMTAGEVRLDRARDRGRRGTSTTAEYGALRLDDAGRAAIGRVGRLVVGGEQRARPERRHACRRRADDVAEPVEVVARLGQQHRAGLVLTPPRRRARTSGRSGTSRPARGGGRRRCRRSPRCSRSARMRSVFGRVAEHVAHAEEHASGRRRSDSGDTLGLGAGERLLAQDVVAGVGERLDRRPMVAILSGDDHCVSDPIGGDEVLPSRRTSPAGRAPGNRRPRPVAADAVRRPARSRLRPDGRRR